MPPSAAPELVAADPEPAAEPAPAPTPEPARRPLRPLPHKRRVACQEPLNCDRGCGFVVSLIIFANGAIICIPCTIMQIIWLLRLRRHMYRQNKETDNVRTYHHIHAALACKIF